MKVHKIYSSDLGRAYATTLEVARQMTRQNGARKKVRVIRDPLLREIHLGDWEGMTPEEVDKLYDKGYQKWLKKPSSVKIPRSESIRHFRQRVTKRVRAIVRINRGKTVLVVTHGGVITALLADWLKADFDNLILNLKLENTGVSFVEETGKRVHVKFINDTSHLNAKHS